ncbi:hypothetical protein L1987_65531 [Smallanthus sonchifolius]|uniref:Uncharacterized protein n=1 Tax=Smallanthus sonchifolius TaxID=185202 RepID=A0ACB9BUY8_9ASTR|nr:hypothetical protein L1987_65531 [Smallanthus sonchifolius]
MGLWRVLQREGRLGKFEVFKPQVPKRVTDKNDSLSKLSQDILSSIWYWYVDPKTGEAVVIGKVWSDSGSLVPREVIRVFDEICFINLSVKDPEVLADKYCMYTDEWTKFLASKYDKVVKFCLDYKRKMEAKAGEP